MLILAPSYGREELRSTYLSKSEIKTGKREGGEYHRVSSPSKSNRDEGKGKGKIRKNAERVGGALIQEFGWSSGVTGKEGDEKEKGRTRRLGGKGKSWQPSSIDGCKK